jgi:hypothetical protein
MGSNVRIIGRHNLDISSLESLAKDLSSRFKANVKYGIYDDVGFNLNGMDRNPKFHHSIFGTAKYSHAKKNLILTNEFYHHHLVLDRYGDDAYNLPYFVENKEQLDEAKENKCYELLDEVTDEDYGTIFNDTFHNWYNYFEHRWIGLYSPFIEKPFYRSTIKEVNSFRYKVMSFFEKIGGAEAYYFDDQGESQYLIETLYNWQNIVKEVETNLQNPVVRLSEFMNNRKLYAEDVYIAAFYDDFADLKNTFPIV